MLTTIIILIFVAALIAIGVRSVRIVPQAEACVAERFGRYHRTLNSGFNIAIPLVDSIRERIDLRQQVISLAPQSAITQDNLSVSIDTVVYYQVTNAYDATYKVSDSITAVEQLVTTTLRNVVGGMDLEQTLTSRDQINRELRSVLEDATSEWGIEVARVELKAIDPSDSFQEAREKQMLADREKRAQILSAEGQKQAAILTAEGEQEALLLRARGAAEAETVQAKAEAEAMTLRARGEADSIAMVFRAIHEAKVSRELLAYHYLQKLPEIAKGDANKVWIVPSEMGRALEGLGGFFDAVRDNGTKPAGEPAGSPDGDGGGADGTDHDGSQPFADPAERGYDNSSVLEE